ncbi:MAG: efflux RND transporter periplasmic adaptor subunit [Hydrogenothermaceae bacterium]
MKKFILIFFIVIALIVSLSFVIKKQNGYKTYKVVSKEIVESVYASGYIDTRDSVLVKSEVSGYVEKIFVKENDYVKKGQVLAKISNPTLYENLKDIQSQIELTAQRLKEDSDFQREFKNSIEMKRLNYENLKNVYERRKKLFERGLIPKESFEEVEKNLKIAEKDYQKQIENYNDTVKSLKSQLESLTAKKEAINREIDKYSIKSPTDGKILRKFVNEGDYINSMTASNQLFMIGNPREVETVLNVDEEYIPLIKEGQKVLIVIDSYPEDVFEGNITVIESATDRNTRTVKVKADVNYTKPVVMGMVVEANIILDKKRGIFIPSESYKEGYVEILENGKITKKAVKVSPKNYNGYLQVLEGISEGQEIVIR